MNQAQIEATTQTKQELVQLTILSQSDVRKQFGISRSRQWQLRTNGKLGYLDFGNGRVGYLPEHIEEYLRRCERIADPSQRNHESQNEKEHSL
jgi:hypothetical protein